METVTISRQDYDQLVDDQQFLEALRAAGVDNWQGFDEAVELRREWNNEAD